MAAFAAISAVTVSGAELPVAEAESVGMSTERLKRIDAALQRHIDAGKIQGAVTAIARRGKVVHFKGHGLMDVEAERPMSRDAIFIMMSSRASSRSSPAYPSTSSCRPGFSILWK